MLLPVHMVGTVVAAVVAVHRLPPEHMVGAVVVVVVAVHRLPPEHMMMMSQGAPQLIACHM